MRENIIYTTVIFTDGINLFPKPKEFEESQFESFFDGAGRWQDTKVRVGLKNRIYFDSQTICADEAWIICSGPIPVSEEKLREIVQRERLSIWKPRSVMEWVEFILD